MRREKPQQQSYGSLCSSQPTKSITGELLLLLFLLIRRDAEAAVEHEDAAVRSELTSGLQDRYLRRQARRARVSL